MKRLFGTTVLLSTIAAVPVAHALSRYADAKPVIMSTYECYYLDSTARGDTTEHHFSVDASITEVLNECMKRYYEIRATENHMVLRT